MRLFRRLRRAADKEPDSRRRQVERHASGSFILEFAVSSADPVIEFRPSASSQHNDSVVVKGAPAFDYWVGCDSCAFLLSCLNGPRVSPTDLADRLREGIDLLAPDLLSDIARLLPTGSYSVAEVLVRPTLTSDGEPDDYFSHESVDLFGHDLDADGQPIPRGPETSYWRAGATTVDSRTWVGGSTLFHLILPTTPLAALDRKRVETFKAGIRESAEPAALGVSVLQVRAPVMGERYEQHAVLSTFLLDGHHKMQAASELDQPIRLLTFLARDASRAPALDHDAAVRGILAISAGTGADAR